MAPEAVGTHTAPDGRHAVRVEMWGEYGMGAEYVRVVLDRPFEGVRAVHGTNVAPAFSPEGSLLLLTDRHVVVLLDYAAGTVRYWQEPKGWTHGLALTATTQFSFLARDGHGGTRTHAWGYDEARWRWRRGWGPAAGGLLPSLNRAMHDVLRARGAFGETPA